MKRIDYLLIAMIFLVLASFVLLAWEASAETRLSSNGIISKDLGYETGIGVKLEQINRWRWLGIDASGHFDYQKKIDAEEGWTYGVQGNIRFYFLNDLYVGGGYGWSGYNSKFDGGKRWAKDETYPVAKIGYDGKQWDVEFVYTGLGSGPNKIESIGLLTRYDWDKWFVELCGKNVWFDNGDDRDEGQSLIIGLGYVWR